jgi:predicted DNA-binding protein
MMPLYLRPDQKDALKRLSARTGVPMQVYIRDAIDVALKKHAKRKGQ